MDSHIGTTNLDANKLADKLRSRHLRVVSSGLLTECYTKPQCSLERQKKIKDWDVRENEKENIS